MSLHFVIDGYNLIKQTRLFNKASLEDSREALMSFLSVSRPQGSHSNRVTVVFDGKEGMFYRQGSTSLSIIFTQGQSADEAIKHLVRNAENPKAMVVVTNDKDIQFFAQQHNAQVKTVEVFMEKFNPPKTKKTLDDKILLNPCDAAKITEEMKKIWLK